MKRKLSISLLLLLFTSTFALGQVRTDFGQSTYMIGSEEQCGHMHAHESRMISDPEYAIEQYVREQSLSQFISQYESGSVQRSDEILTIPLVVHIIHKGEAYGVGTNITDEQVYSAINGLNEDFRKMAGTWGDGNGADVGVEFCLAQRDPNGNAHSGINRVNGCSVALYCDQGITVGQGQGAHEMNTKNLSRWPNQQYYNIWVVSEIENNNGGSGIQGYAYFPTTSHVDGTVLLFNAFGTVGNLKSYTNRNRTLTHELGHAFSLFHTFQGASCATESNCNTAGDRVCDTPPTVLNSNCGNPACGGTQQVNNYMDYTSQLCKNMFTEGQKARMRASIINSRPNLLLSNGCQAVGSVLADAAINQILRPEGSSCSNLIQPRVSLHNAGSTQLSSATIEYRTGGAWQAFNWTGLLGPGQSTILQLPQYNGGWGARTLQVRVVNPNGGADANDSNNQMNKQYIAVQNGNNLTLTLTLDNLGTQNTWLFRDDNGNIMMSGGPYTNWTNGTVHTYQVCLPDGCYQFEINDSGNNGMCCFNGSGGYTLVESDGTEIAAGGAFGGQDLTSFCLEDDQTPPPPPPPPAPVANFTASSTQVCAGASVAFTNTSTGTVVNNAWQFPGGTPSTSTAANPGNITYNTPGNYNVQLTVSNNGGSHAETKTNYISVLANQTWYADNDGDGYGNPNVTVVSCTQPSGYVGNANDCDDNNPNDWDSCYDCAGVMNGSSTVDPCGVCDDNPNNDCDPCDSLNISLTAALQASCNGGADGSIAVAVTSFSGTHTVQWSNGSTGTQINGLSAGTYTATLSSGSCQTTLEVVLGEPAPIEILVSNLQHVACGEENTGAVTIGVTGGTDAVTLVALGQSIAPGTYTGLAAGNYNIVATDANNCSITRQVTIHNVPCDNLDATQLEPEYCGNSELQFFENVHCDPVTAALHYEWNFTDELTSTTFEFITEDAYFIPADVASIIPSTVYSVMVRGVHPEVDSEFGEACEVAFRIQSSALVAGDCNNHSLNEDAIISCLLVEGAEQYEFRFEDSETGTRSYAYAGANGQVDLGQQAELEAGKIYLTDVRARYRNVWGVHGSTCSIAMSKNEFVPTLTSGTCGKFDLDAEKDSLRLQPINGATVYALEFSAAGLTQALEVESSTSLFTPPQFIDLPKGELLTVRLRVRMNGMWTAWSQSCTMSFANENNAQQEFTMNLFIYPNPIISGRELSARMNGDWENVELTLRNLAGTTLKKLRRSFTHMQSQSFDLSNIETGIYFITAVHGTSTLTKKLIVQ